MSSRPRVLVLSQCLPYPPDSGVTNRTFNVLRQLQREFDVVVLPYHRRNHQPNAEALQAARAALEGYVTRVAAPVPIRAEHAIVRRAWDHGRSVLSGRAYTYYEYASGQYRDQLQRALSESPPALVHLDSLVLHRWLPYLPAVPLVCTHHNIESDVLRLRAARTRSPLLARYILHQSAKVEATERRLVAGFRANVMMSQQDAERLRRLSPRARTVVVPNGVDTTFFVPEVGRPAIPGRIAFLGPTYLFPNRDGMEYLLEQMWPQIRSAIPGATLRLIGKSPAADRARFDAVPGVACLGLVPDIRPHLAEAGCCVVPLRVGGGTRLKILDSWAMGKAVVSTSLGCEGLDAVDGENILIRDDPKAFAEAVAAVLTDAGLRRRLERNARQTVEARYSWDMIGERLRAAYHEIIGSRLAQPLLQT
jgi:glycosyltransferase involved in cell wall biosynthesis